MKDRRKNRKRKKILFLLYIIFCLCIIIAAYLHIRKIAFDFNTQHMELITGLYAEKMNDTMEYLQSYAEENVMMIQAMREKEPEEILLDLENNLDHTIFCNIGFILKNNKILGNESAVLDIKKQKLDQTALALDTAFNSDPYQSGQTGTMIMTVFVPIEDSPQIERLYMSITIEDICQLGVYEQLRGKIDVHLLKAASENFITFISSNSEKTGHWNNLLLQRKYFRFDKDYSYNQWIKDMNSGKKEGRFSAEIKGDECTISYRSINSMPGWYVVVQLANKNVADITRQFSVWGGVYGGILVGLTISYMLIILLIEKRDKKHYMGLSTIDNLTGILNRMAFQRAVEEEIQKKTPGFFVFIDVDNFKTYNDKYGHQNGDLCLSHFADAMKKCFPKETILGRYGGDEFVVYFKNISAEKVHNYMKEFQEKISQVKISSGEWVKLSASAGGAAFPDQGEDYISLCRKADIALYDVKQNGKAHFKM